MPRRTPRCTPRPCSRSTLSCPRASTIASPARTARLGVIFVRPGVAEVHEQAIAEVLGDMPVKARNHLGAGLLIGPHHLAEILRVELAGERGRVDQVTEQYRELAAFRLRGIWYKWRGRNLPRRVSWRHELWCRWRGRRYLHRCRYCVTSPTQASALVIDHLRVSIEEFILEIVEGVLVEVKLTLECPVRHALPLTEEVKNLI